MFQPAAHIGRRADSGQHPFQALRPGRSTLLTTVLAALRWNREVRTPAAGLRLDRRTGPVFGPT